MDELVYDLVVAQRALAHLSNRMEHQGVEIDSELYQKVQEAEINLMLAIEIINPVLFDEMYNGERDEITYEGLR